MSGYVDRAAVQRNAILRARSAILHQHARRWSLSAARFLPGTVERDVLRAAASGLFGPEIARSSYGISRINLSIEFRRVQVQSPPFLGAAAGGGTGGGALSN